MNPMRNPMQMLSEFNRFKNEFKGDPEEAVKKLVASGKISQKQLNDLQMAAQTFRGLFNI